MKDVTLLPGDVFLTYGAGFFSKLIRIFTRTIGESRTRVNHTGIVVTEGDIETCQVVETLLRVRKHRLWKRYGPFSHDRVAVYRPVNLTPEEIDTIVASALKQVGKRYGIFTVFGHLLDWLLLGAYVFRRITQNANYPICSWLVAYAFARAGKNFNVEPGAAQPDDIWDFIQKNPDKYQQIHPLEQIWKMPERHRH
ncbi:MAG: hypothetical protein PVF71_08550 [Desulfobacterales bacterium]